MKAALRDEERGEQECASVRPLQPVRLEQSEETHADGVRVLAEVVRAAHESAGWPERGGATRRTSALTH